MPGPPERVPGNRGRLVSGGRNVKLFAVRAQRNTSTSRRREVVIDLRDRLRTLYRDRE